MNNHLDDLLNCLRFWTRETYPDNCRLVRNDITELDRLEKSLDISLPADYRDFLNRYGAIRLDNALIRSTTHDDERIGWEESVAALSFYGIYSCPPTEKCSFDLGTVARRYRDSLPARFIPFAEFGSDQFCIACNGPNRGRIFLKAPEQFDDDKPEDFLFPQAPSFLDFLQSLKTMTDEEADAWYRARGG